MTAYYYPSMYDFLGETATKKINNVSVINRITYDIISKLSGSIEWE